MFSKILQPSLELLGHYMQAAVANQLPLSTMTTRQPQEAPWVKGMFVPFLCKGAVWAMILLTSALAI